MKTIAILIATLACDAHVAYRRPHVVRKLDLADPDTELPIDILIRLAEIRQRAMQAYREKRA